MTPHRVVFDFVVHFTNGGQLSAQDFRLDIEGEAIDDDVLAAYLIRDMRLLMAGRVDIANKRVVEEPHKRGAIDVRGLPATTIELAATPVSLEDVLVRADAAPVRIVAAGGESYVVSRLVD